MKKLFFSLVMCSLLVVLLGAPTSQAQYEDLYGLAPEIGLELPNLGYVTLRGNVPDAKCQGFFNRVGITYPTGTGYPDLDATLAKAAGNDDFQALANSDVDRCPSSDETVDTNFTSHRKTFRGTSPGKKYLSFLYTTFKESYYAAHPSTTTDSVTYDLTTLKAIELSDLFDDPKKAIEGLWPYVAKGWCDKGQGTLPNYYGLAEADNACGAKTPPVPETIKSDTVPFSALGKVILTTEGLTVHLDAYDAWDYATGPADLDIPKDFLASIGAKKDIWQ
ncbi:MAG: hypothetical protein LBU69_02545 [Deltaproteobacteria bacterium]|jgi:hypothetical protein|nr:hypothetical protein [Deltaproteobacteria bacterium]